jgi:hypothetical protein
MIFRLFFKPADGSFGHFNGLGKGCTVLREFANGSSGIIAIQGNGVLAEGRESLSHAIQGSLQIFKLSSQLGIEGVFQ